MRIAGFTFAVGVALCVALTATAHVSERALVLILPTDVYIVFGVAAVAVTVFLTVLVPARAVRRIFNISKEPEEETIGSRPLSPILSKLRLTSSLIVMLIFAAMIAIGLFGSRDPLANLLPLVVFTGWWICLPILQALFGDIWGWFNPWRGAVALIFRTRHWFHLPEWLGVWPALLTYLLAAVYTLTDIAPDDPARLAWVAGGYWLFTFAMCGLFGAEWLNRGEGFTVFFNLLARLSPIRWRPIGVQFVGQALISGPVARPSMAVFTVTLLALGSFDGLNETFWWMGQIGINPLEFPGRSAVVWQNRLGMFAAVILLNGLFAACVWIGLALVGRVRMFGRLYCLLALSVLPIALGYHLAHYLTSAMVGIQYLVKALNDPLGTGAAWLGLQDFYVTTGFFNQYESVEKIWLTQAGAIVVAHMLAVILAHAIALREFGSHRIAVVSQVPVAAFMVAYTFFGLWLLASPVAL